MANVNLDSIPTVSLLEELRRRYNCLSKPEGRYIFLGGPGSGKGTQSLQVKNSHCFCHLSTGDMLRAAIEANTEIGKKAKDILDAGELVGDDIVMELIKDKVGAAECKRGFILDGVPRTLEQAKMLDNLLEEQKLKLDGVFYFNASTDLLVKRVCGRRIHPASGRLYHVDFNPPKVPNQDDVTGEPLVHRKDDNESIIRKRLSIFETQTSPLVEYYNKGGLLHTLDATRASKDITNEIYSVIESRYVKRQDMQQQA